ncbi:MAG: MoaD/ThiS family protein [Bacillota bacterium]
MQVTVKYVGPSIFEKGINTISIEIDEGLTIRELLFLLIERYGEDFKHLILDEQTRLLYICIVVNGKEAEMDYIIEKNDYVIILPPFGCG